MIAGLLGGGLGATPARMPSPPHNPQGTTWPGTLGTTNPGDPVFTPPVQADRVRSFATEVAAGASADLVWSAANLRPGTYLLQSGTQPSIQAPMGLYGVLVVTDPNYPGQAFDKEAVVLLSEIDPDQNAEVAAVVSNAVFSDTTVWSGAIGACGDITKPSSAHTCYPPTVNYSPRYYLVNGTSFDRNNPASSSLVGPGATASSGNVLLRFVNAGLRMHVPTVVGANMTLQGSPIDAFGVGTKLVTGQDDAALDGVYKLSMSDYKPRLKISENPEKIILPGIKNVWRYTDNSGKFYADSIALADEGNIDIIYHPHYPDKNSSVGAYIKESLCHKVMDKGRIIIDKKTPAEIAGYVYARLGQLPDEHKSFENPHIYKVGISKKLMVLRSVIIEDIKGQYKRGE